MENSTSQLKGKIYGLRYQVFARFCGRTPEEQDEIDRKTFHKAQYQSWLGKQLRKWCVVKGTKLPLSGHEQILFDEDLLEKKFSDAERKAFFKEWDQD